MKDLINVKGSLDLYIRDKYNRLISHIHQKNLVVNLGRNNLAKLLGGDFTDRNITDVGFGTYSQPPVLSNIDLTNKYSKAISSVSYPQTGAVRFDFLLDFGENNGVNIYEFGLFSADGTMFSRLVRQEAISKTSDFKIDGEWTIQF
jgi:hypothetical protein